MRAPEADAGELVALGRIDGVATGAFLGAAEAGPFPEPPPPVYELAIATKDRKDDVKLSASLQKLVQEDPSLSVEQRMETSETVLQGQGEIHLNAALERLSSVYNIAVSASAPKIPYKETIRRAVSQHGRLKRQTGGHGQFADVKLEIEPRPRGAGFLFTDKIVGGAVPRQYIPAVREAAEEAMQKGPLGYPVVDVGVTLVDGGFHSVDSSDMAFRTATRIAIAEGLAKAEPVLLEPVDHVTVSVPNDLHGRGPAPAQRAARPNHGLYGKAGLARLGRRRGAGPRRRATRPHHAAEIRYNGTRRLSPPLRSSLRGAALIRRAASKTPALSWELDGEHVELIDRRWEGEQFVRFGQQRFRDPSGQMRLARVLIGEGVEDREGRGAETHREPRDRSGLGFDQGKSGGQKIGDGLLFARLGFEGNIQGELDHVGVSDLA